MSAGLIPEPPLLVLPRLAATIGLNEAIVVQQLHFWTKSMRPEGGWIYNTIAEWREQFPFWSEPTIKRIWRSLREKGLVETSHTKSVDRTTLYRLVYPRVRELAPSDQFDPMADQVDPMDGSKRSDVNNPETTHRQDTSGKPDAKVVRELFDFWVKTVGKRNPKFSEKRKKRIRARLAEGFTPEEVRSAIVGVTRSPHHMGDNDRGPNGEGKPFNDIELICRDPEHVEDLRDLAAKAQANGNGKAAFDRFLHKEIA